MQNIAELTHACDINVDNKKRRKEEIHKDTSKLYRPCLEAHWIRMDRDTFEKDSLSLLDWSQLLE